MAKKVKYVDAWAAHVPQLCKQAKPSAWETVSDANAVRLENAQYRGAMLSDVFELADMVDPWVTINGEQRLVLRVYWFGHRPHTRFPAVRVTDGTFHLLHHYDGPVVRNVSL